LQCKSRRQNSGRVEHEKITRIKEGRKISNNEMFRRVPVTAVDQKSSSIPFGERVLGDCGFG
jgi:hypothetical protein